MFGVKINSCLEIFFIWIWCVGKRKKSSFQLKYMQFSLQTFYFSCYAFNIKVISWVMISHFRKFVHLPPASTPKIRKIKWSWMRWRDNFCETFHSFSMWAHTFAIHISIVKKRAWTGCVWASAICLNVPYCCWSPFYIMNWCVFAKRVWHTCVVQCAQHMHMKRIRNGHRPSDNIIFHIGAIRWKHHKN